MTKPITAIAIMQLYERGKLQLDDNSSMYCPEFKNMSVIDKQGKCTQAEKEITILDLLTHTSGLSYGEYGKTGELIDDMYDNAHLFDGDISLSEMITRLAKLPLAHQPGKQWRYSIASDVLGRVIEVCSNMSLADYFAKYIFIPLGMSDTSFSVPNTKLDRLSSIYTMDIKKQLHPYVAPEDFMTPKGCFGGQGLISTAIDYSILTRMMLNRGVFNKNRILKKETLDNMVSNQLTSSMQSELAEWGYPKTGFGLGMSVVQKTGKEMPCTVGTYGWGGMAGTDFFIDPVKELSAVFMMQRISSENKNTRQEFRQIIYDTC